MTLRVILRVTLHPGEGGGVNSILSDVPLDQTEVGAPVRLVGGASSTEGRLEVMINGTWGGACSSTWNQANSEVICNQLGFYGNANTAAFGQFGDPYYCKWKTLNCTLLSPV